MNILETPKWELRTRPGAHGSDNVTISWLFNTLCVCCFGFFGGFFCVWVCVCMCERESLNIVLGRKELEMLLTLPVHWVHCNAFISLSKRWSKRKEKLSLKASCLSRSTSILKTENVATGKAKYLTHKICLVSQISGASFPAMGQPSSVH